jgi:hypothetical protein
VDKQESRIDKQGKILAVIVVKIAQTPPSEHLYKESLPGKQIKKDHCT